MKTTLKTTLLPNLLILTAFAELTYAQGGDTLRPAWSRRLNLNT